MEGADWWGWRSSQTLQLQYIKNVNWRIVRSHLANASFLSWQRPWGHGRWNFLSPRHRIWPDVAWQRGDAAMTPLKSVPTRKFLEENCISIAVCYLRIILVKIWRFPCMQTWTLTRLPHHSAESCLWCLRPRYEIPLSIFKLAEQRVCGWAQRPVN